MAILSTNPSSEELANLAAIFRSAANSLRAYLSSPSGNADPNFTQLSTLVINLNNASATIAVMQLSLAVDQAANAIGVINRTVAQLQKAITLRNDITRDLGIIQDLVAFGAAIAAKDPNSIISSGTDLYNKLKPILDGGGTTAVS